MALVDVDNLSNMLMPLELVISFQHPRLTCARLWRLIYGAPVVTFQWISRAPLPLL